MTTPAEIAARKRKLRRRHKRERQAVIFGAVLAGLAVVGLGAAAVWTGSMDSPIERDWTTVSEAPTEAALTVPCVAADTLPVSYDDITVNVYNATSRPGLAGSVADLLGQRGFEIGERDNFSIKLSGVGRIRFGAQGVAAAYTLWAHVPGAALAYDARTDGTVDLALGAEFSQLVELDRVPLAADEPLEPAVGCVPLAEAEPQPAPQRGVQAEDDEIDSEDDLEEEQVTQEDVEGDAEGGSEGEDG